MSKANTWENGLLSLVFENTPFTTLGDAGGLLGSATAGSIYISLHTADPGEAGDQTTNETVYTNYTRIGVGRSSANWTVSSGTCDNDNVITFPTCGATGATITHFGVGAASLAAGKLMYSGALTSSLAVANGITPEFAAGDCNITED